VQDFGTLRSINAKHSDSYLDAMTEINAKKLAAAKAAAFQASPLGRLLAWWKAL